jgi:CubicO group peptidase (beta-lactamase class C family)
MQLAEVGRLDLDAPVYTILDPWFNKQGLPNISTLWSGDGTIAAVTSRNLLGMQSGLADYADPQAKNWTIENPQRDILPMDFVHALNKTFLFPPGKGAAYSGDGYVLLGMVLAALTGATSWRNFDQLNALGEVDPPLNQTIFMKTGQCSQYPRIVHQYAIRPTRDSGPPSREGRGEADFIDLWNTSCLNGWTMGNIAVTVEDGARFFYLLGSEQLTSADSLLQMQGWHNITQGFGVGSLQYGLGLINMRHQAQNDVTGAAVNWTHHWGHDGVDWGSKSTLNGYYPNLGAAILLAQNAESAMNFSVPRQQGAVHTAPPPITLGGHAQMHCRLENAVFQFIHPDEPALACSR